MLVVVMNVWLDPKLVRVASPPQPLAASKDTARHQCKRPKSGNSRSSTSFAGTDVLDKAAGPEAASQPSAENTADKICECEELLLLFLDRPADPLSVASDALQGHQLPSDLNALSALDFSQHATEDPCVELLSWLDKPA